MNELFTPKVTLVPVESTYFHSANYSKEQIPILSNGVKLKRVSIVDYNNATINISNNHIRTMYGIPLTKLLQYQQCVVQLTIINSEKKKKPVKRVKQQTYPEHTSFTNKKLHCIGSPRIFGGYIYGTKSKKIVGTKLLVPRICRVPLKNFAKTHVEKLPMVEKIDKANKQKL